MKMFKGYRTLIIAFAFQLQALLEPIFIAGASISWNQFFMATVFALLRLVTTSPPGEKE